MSAGDLHLAVHIDAWWTTAVYESGASVQPVIFEGQARLPSGVFHDPDSGALLTGTAALETGMAHPDGYHPDPMNLLLNAGAGDNGERVDSVAVVSAVLAHVANVASGQTGAPVSALTIVTSQAWGHRARQRLHQAATNASLPQPHIVTAAAAAAALVTPDPSDTRGQGRFVAVCAIDGAAPELTVLDVGAAYQELAAASVRDPDAPPIDQALIRLAVDRADAGTDAGAVSIDWRLARDIEQIRAVLAVQPRASMLLPEPHPAVVISRDDLTGVAAAHLNRLDHTVKRLLADADLDPSDIAAVVLLGEDATVADVQAALAESGLPPPVVLRDPHAVANGAVRLGRPLTMTDSSGTAATMRLPRTRLTAGNLTGVAVLAACSVALLLQAVATAETWTIGTTITGVRLPVENVALAATLATLTVWTAAQLAPTTWIVSSHADDDTATGALLRRGYFAAAAIGVALAGLWGLGAGVGVGYASDGYLRAALTAAVPVAGCAAVIAFAAPRIPAPALLDWLRRARPPVTAIALAAAGVYIQRAAGTLTFPVNLIGMSGLAQTTGAALLGVATAITATRRPLIRVITALILGIGYALVTSASTVHYLTIAYIVVLAWWALVTTTATITAAAPRNLTWLTAQWTEGSR